MTFIPTKWTTGDWIPRRGLKAWHAADTTDTGAGVDDASGNSFHLDSGIGPGNATVLTADVINGLPGLYFSGVDVPPPLRSNQGNVTLRHAFVVAAYEDAAFPSGEPGYAGLLSGITTGDLLVGNPSSTKFFDLNLETFGTYSYRRRDMAFNENNMQASFNDSISVFEVSISSGVTFDDIQVGMHRNAGSTRRWKGFFVEQMLYDRVLADFERHQVYEYLAMKYRLWKRDKSDLDVFPFQPNWARSLTADKVVLASRSVSGATKARSKSAAKKSFEASFEDRLAEEYDAAYAFWDQKYPGTSFIYRDDAFSPARDTEVLFTSPMPNQQAGYNQINYGLQFLEV